MQTCRQSGRLSRVAALGQRIGRALALEVRARHVVQQQVVLQVEQVSQPLLQMLLDARFVRQQPVQAVVETIRMHLLRRHAQQVLQRRAAIPRGLDVQLARRPAEPGDASRIAATTGQGTSSRARRRLLARACPAPTAATAPTPSTRRRSPAAAPGGTSRSRTTPARRPTDRRNAADRTTTAAAAACPRAPAQLGPAALLAPSTRPSKRPPAAAIPGPCDRTPPCPVAVRLAVLLAEQRRKYSSSILAGPTAGPSAGSPTSSRPARGRVFTDIGFRTQNLCGCSRNDDALSKISKRISQQRNLG